MPLVRSNVRHSRTLGFILACRSRGRSHTRRGASVGDIVQRWALPIEIVLGRHTSSVHGSRVGRIAGVDVRAGQWAI